MRIGLQVSTTEQYDDVLRRLVDDGVAGKLAQQDPSLWGDEARSEAEIRLSWVDLPVSSRPLLAEVDALRAELWAEGIDRVVLCGMGGSSLAPQLITSTYGVPLRALDSTDPSAVARETQAGAALEKTVVVVSSKSGTTLETDSHRRAFISAFQEAGIDPAQRLVVVTDPGSELEQIARAGGYRRVFLADPHVGGRYSALTAFGLVPSGLAGVDIADLLDEAEEVMAQVAADSTDNPALRLAAAICANAGRNKVVIAEAGSGLRGFAEWAEQLLAESTGKNGTGVLPVAVEGVDAPEVASSAADLVIALLAAEDATDSALAQTATGGKPAVAVCGTLGAQILTWETATAVAGQLLGINPFDQPDVESAKHAARGLLEQRPEPDPPDFVERDIEVRGPDSLLDGRDSLTDVLAALLGQLGDTGYLAVMAYLDPERDHRLSQVRAALASRTGRPVTFGWGPRFLHSTGQYHKGGPPQGVFLQLTCSEDVDIAIPERPFGFGELIAAQAAGDAVVLAQHGRPVLRLHLRKPEHGVAVLHELLR